MGKMKMLFTSSAKATTQASPSSIPALIVSPVRHPLPGKSSFTTGSVTGYGRLKPFAPAW